MVKVKDRFRFTLPYAGLPILCAALFVVRFGQIEPMILLRSGLVLAFGYVAAVLDMKTKRIPNNLVLAMLAAWVLMMTPMLFYDTSGAIPLLRDSIFGFLIGGGIFLLVYLISRKGLGGGDVKFMAAAGLYLGFGGAISVILLGSILASITGLTLIALKKIGRKDSMPLAPFLYVGILLTVFFA